MQATVFIATSLDGFIARPDGGLDWLPAPSPHEDYGYGAFIATVDTMVMGRHTYETALGFHEWPYGRMRVVVLTSRGAPAAPPGARVDVMSGLPREIARRLEQEGARHVYVDGGITIQRFLDAGLIDRLIVTRVPVLLGAGIPLFGPLPRDIALRHVATRSYPTGLVQSEYVVAR